MLEEVAALRLHTGPEKNLRHMNTVKKFHITWQCESIVKADNWISYQDDLDFTHFS